MKKLFSLPLFLLIFFMTSGNLFSQLALDESFTGVTFPPDGWTSIQVSGTAQGIWARNTSSFRTTPACAYSQFNGSGAENWLITKKITPLAGDSLVFWWRHTYSAGVAVEDTFEVKTSSTDSLKPSFTTNIFHLNIPNYGATATYFRVAILLPAGTKYIAFRHIDLDGDDIRVDDITVGVPPPNANDVGVSANVAPSGNYKVGNPNVTPSVKIKNYGLNAQGTAFMTVYKITGPVNYQDSTSTTLLVNQEKTITFPGTFSFTLVGTYNVTAYTELGSDQNRTNDTLKTTFAVGPPFLANFGNDSGYFYANNLATNQPSYPRWGWKDTTGSKSLMVNGVSTGFATLAGSLDDGYYRLGLADILIACGQDPTDRHIKFNGNCYDSIFPGTNGIVGLTQQFGTTSLSAFNIDGINVAKNALLPFWHDFNLGTLTFNLTNRLSVKAKGDQLILTYSKVAAFSPTEEWASFQVVIELVTGCASANSNFRYTYADTTGGMSSDSLVKDYLNSNQAAPPAAMNFRNYVVGWSGNGAPNAYAAYCTSLNALGGPNNLFVKRSIYDITTKKGLAVEFGPNQNKLDLHNSHVLGISLALEGLRANGDGPRVRDTVQVILRDGSGPPYKIMQKQFVYLDSVYTTYAFGRKYVELSMLKKSSLYYLQVKHRNSITTWSVLDSTQQQDTILYNFTTNVCRAYACNQANAPLLGGVSVPSFYTGNVSGDDCVDASDILAIYNDASVVLEGPYVITDLNWDGIVDNTDIILCYNNIPPVICEAAPPGAGRPVLNDPVPVEIQAPVFSIPDVNVMTKEQYFQSIEENQKSEELKLKNQSQE